VILGPAKKKAVHTFSGGRVIVIADQASGGAGGKKRRPDLVGLRGFREKTGWAQRSPAAAAGNQSWVDRVCLHRGVCWRGSFRVIPLGSSWTAVEFLFRGETIHKKTVVGGRTFPSENWAAGLGGKPEEGRPTKRPDRKGEKTDRGTSLTGQYKSPLPRGHSTLQADGPIADVSEEQVA